MNDTSIHPEAPKILLSVVMTNFNHGHLIGRALDALATQERPADEIIVVDDASTDESLVILERYRLRIPQLTILESVRNGGNVAASQRGLEAASGRYVYFAAADDWVLPGFFSIALSILQAHPDCGFICGDSLLLNGETGALLGYRPAVRPSIRGAKFTPELTRRLLARADNFILSGSALFRRDVVIAKGGFDGRAGSFTDGLLTRKIALTHGFYFAPNTFAVWNIFTQGFSRSTALDVERAKKALRDLPTLLENDSDIPDWYPALFRKRWRFGVARLALESQPPLGRLLIEMGSTSALDGRILSALVPWIGFRLTRWLALAFLTLRLKPYRLRDLAATYLARRGLI